MPEGQMVDERLAAIERKLTEIHTVLISLNIVSPPSNIRDLARQVATGNKAALRSHNRAQRKKYQ